MLLSAEGGYNESSSHPWTGVPALVQEVNGSTVFRYQNNAVKDKYGMKSGQDAMLDLELIDFNLSIEILLNHNN